jgi:hypothetical protein
VAFGDRLLATIRATRPVLETQGVLVIGSEVPNLLEPGAAASSHKTWTSAYLSTDTRR